MSEWLFACSPLSLLSINIGYVPFHELSECRIITDWRPMRPVEDIRTFVKKAIGLESLEILC